MDDNEAEGTMSKPDSLASPEKIGPPLFTLHQIDWFAELIVSGCTGPTSMKSELRKKFAELREAYIEIERRIAVHNVAIGRLQAIQAQLKSSKNDESQR